LKKESQVLYKNDTRTTINGGFARKNISDVQAPNFKVFAIHDNVIEAEQYREPKPDHAIIHRLIWIRVVGGQRTFGSLKHHWNNTTEHGNRQQADLLVFTNFAELRDANRKVSKCSVLNDCTKMVTV
jgi:hypothetical protein